ncbi:hypothetical protein RchiOBHm_Chr5g0073741 [Rosa chinensis]|uniref:Uncharacterized protein n=1 Tax=Rosa chinensis TaxID=74649 RepID=A0A2P6QL19_ROSCH|nr:hypothetical protein RchiOBHm_Chr5g0073741 [Rosa chinensis]
MLEVKLALAAHFGEGDLNWVKLFNGLRSIEIPTKIPKFISLLLQSQFPITAVD